MTTLYSTFDTYLSSTAPTSSFGTVAYTRVGYVTKGSNSLVSLYSFDLTGIVGPIKSAVLSRLVQDTIPVPQGSPTKIRRVLRDFVEAEATWNLWRTGNSWTTPGCGGAETDYTALHEVSSSLPNGIGQYKTDEVGAIVQDCLDLALTRLNLVEMLAAVVGADWANYFSRETSGNSISLTIVPVQLVASRPNRTRPSLRLRRL